MTAGSVRLWLVSTAMAIPSRAASAPPSGSRAAGRSGRGPASPSISVGLDAEAVRHARLVRARSGLTSPSIAWTDAVLEHAAAVQGARPAREVARRGGQRAGARAAVTTEVNGHDSVPSDRSMGRHPVDVDPKR